MTVFEDHAGREIRLTDERREHVERRPEMVGQLERIEQTLAKPDELRRNSPKTSRQCPFCVPEDWNPGWTTTRSKGLYLELS